MTWDGDISKIGELADRLGDLARVPSIAAERVAHELEDLIQAEFDGQHDPYGHAWKKHAPATVQRWGEHPILDLTSKMRGSVNVRPMQGAGVAISIAHPAAPHQTGWSGPQGSGPARPILPAGRALPESWQETIDETIEREVHRRMGR